MKPFFENISALPDFNFIKTEKENHLFKIILARPEKRNAFTPTMIAEIALSLQFANENDDIWCVLLQAEGTVFCAGMDLNVFQNSDLDSKNENLPNPNREITIGDAFSMLNKPSIAKVEGNVLAGGFLFICGCTFVIATENAEFGLPEVKRGIFPMQVMASLMKILPQRKVLEMCILGKNYTAKEAFEIGLISFPPCKVGEVGEKGEIGESVNYLIDLILENSPFAIKKGLEAFNELPNLTEKEKHSYLKNQLSEIRNSSDATEGILAFKEKRKPNWKNS